MPILQFRNLTKRYEDKLAVDNLSIDVEEGDIFGLLGPNGAGKSTTISMVCGLTKIDMGEIFVNGHSINKEPVIAKENIGMVPQDIALYKNLSAIDNLKFWGTLYGLNGKLLKERIDEVLAATGLKDRAKEKISNYSGGMKRRINIAAAVMHHPKILIMDEPTVGIDPQSRNHILEFTKDLNKKYGTTVIYTSHYIEEVEMLCNKLAIMDEGKIIANGTQDEVKRMVINEEKVEIATTNYSTQTGLSLKQLKSVKEIDFKDDQLTVIMKNSESDIQNIIEVLISNNVRIKNISIKSPNLETVFLSLTGKSLRD
jgi:ABC-2 type transport system ATP-binding protein